MLFQRHPYPGSREEHIQAAECPEPRDVGRGKYCQRCTWCL